MKHIIILIAMAISSLAANAQGARIKIEFNGHTLTATLAENSSAEALVELLEKGPMTVDMHDYGNFEKVGDLPQSLPRNDEDITTKAGDLILYLGTRIVIYYDTNTWDFTRLGWIDDVENINLKELLGDGNVSVTFSLLSSGVALNKVRGGQAGVVYNLNGQVAGATDRIQIVDGQLRGSL